MQLSPYTQYYIRKLLRQHINHINYPLFGVGICDYFQLDLGELLQRIYPKGFDFTIKVQELETLVRLHQSSDAAKADPSKSLFELEQKILGILDLEFLSLLLDQELPIVTETDGSLFHFVLKGQIHQGLRYADQLYGMVLEFGAEPNLVASRLLLTLRDQQIPFILTASQFRHGIWVNLRSSTYSALLFKQERLKQDRPLEKIA